MNKFIDFIYDHGKWWWIYETPEGVLVALEA